MTFANQVQHRFTGFEERALVADESPIRWSRLFCTRWNGLNKSSDTINAFDDAEYSGSVLLLIDNGEAFIKRNEKLMWRKTANSREEMPEYVERSYYEALVNALAHKDYLVNGSEVHIDIYDDRMEIYSLGGMPDGSIIQDRDPLTVPSTRRKQVLADIFTKIVISGRIRTGGYTDSEGVKRYSSNVVVEEHFLAESKKVSDIDSKDEKDGFMSVPEDAELLFE